MKKKFLLLLLLTTSLAWAGDYEDSLAAYHQRDFTKALSFAQKAAAKGNSDAQFLVGLMFDKGQGVVQDYRIAVRWYKLSASQGNPQAQHNIARMIYFGRGINQSYALAYYWFMIASANGGSNESTTSLELAGQAMTITGQEIIKDLARQCELQKFRGCEKFLKWSDE